MKPAARRTIEGADRVYVSAASLWEVAIKAGLGKTDADPGALIASIDDSGFVELPVTAAHAAAVADLPAHHVDPFNRLLIAQALAEPLKLPTADAMLSRYSPSLVIMA